VSGVQFSPVHHFFFQISREVGLNHPDEPRHKKIRCPSP
jgi:hypothetical protein